MTIQLTVTIAAHYTDWDDCPPDQVHSAETAIVQIPQLEAKFVVFPKLLDGLTGRAIERLRNEADKHRNAQANPTLFDEPPTPPWPSEETLARDDVLIDHCMHLLDDATYGRCYTDNLIIGLADVQDDSEGGNPARVYTWYMYDDDDPDDVKVIVLGERFGNFYEAAGSALAYLDSLEGLGVEHPDLREVDDAGDDLSVGEPPADWRAPNFVTDDIKDLAGRGYQMQVCKYKGQWIYRWRHELNDGTQVDVSVPFASMEDAMADARRYLDEPEPEVA